MRGPVNTPTLQPRAVFLNQWSAALQWATALFYLAKIDNFRQKFHKNDKNQPY